MQRYLSLILIGAFMTMTLSLHPPAHALRYEGEEGEKTTKSIKTSKPVRDYQKGSRGTSASDSEKKSDKALEKKQEIQIKIHPKGEKEGGKE